MVCSSNPGLFRTPQRPGCQNVAIVISISVYNKLSGVGNVGSIVGVCHHSTCSFSYMFTGRDCYQWIFLVHCWSRQFHHSLQNPATTSQGMSIARQLFCFTLPSSSDGQARRKQDSGHGETGPELVPNQNMLMMRLLGPLVNFVNRPWKVLVQF